MGHIFLNFIFYNFILISVYRHYKHGDYYINKNKLIYYTFILIAFGTFGSGEGDSLHYEASVKMIHSLLEAESRLNGMELQYNYLAYLVDGNYYLWRFVIFSIQFIGMSLMMYKAKLNTYPTLLCFVSFFLILSVYQRSYWGVIYFFLGLYLLIEKKNPLFIIVMALCYLSHTQNILLFAMLPLAFIEFKKWHMLILFIYIGIMGPMLNNHFSNILDAGGIDGADYISGKMALYSQSEIGFFGASIGEYTISFLRYLPMVLFLLTWMRIILLRRDFYISFYRPFQRILNITVGILATSIVIYAADLGGGTFFYRTVAMAYFPVTILLPYMIDNHVIKHTTFNRYLIIFTIGSELSCLKDLYYAYVGGL